MADMIHFDVTGTRQVGLRFEAFPQGMHDDLRAAVEDLSAQLYASVFAATPDRTGRLRSQERVRLFDDPNRITGYIDIAGEGSGKNSDFAKAAALEDGASGSTKVPTHTMKLDHYWSNALAAPVTVVVEAYSRPSNLAAERFERGPLEAMQPEIIARLNAVVAKNTAEANA